MGMNLDHLSQQNHIMVGTNIEEKEVFSRISRMTNKSDASEWNNHTVPHYQDSDLEYGVQLKKGRKVYLNKSAKVKRRRVKAPNIQGACCCAANCNCKCLMCACRSQKIAVAGNKEAIRARKQAMKRKERSQRVRNVREQSKEELSSSSLVAQLTELVNRNRQRANQKKRQEKKRTATGEAKPAEIQPVKTASIGSVPNKSKSQLKDLEPSSGSPANDDIRVNEARKQFRKRKRQDSSHSSHIVYASAKPKDNAYQTKKRRLERHSTSHSSTSSSSASKITKFRRRARDKNSNTKPPKK